MVEREQVTRSKAIQRRTGKTFHLATRVLPERVRHDTYVLYAFFRIADEVVDDAEGVSAEEQRERLESFREAALGRSETDEPVLSAFSELRERHDISESDVDVFIDAMLSDVTKDRYETYAEVEAYMDGSAAAVGRMMTAIMHPEDRERVDAPDPADASGRDSPAGDGDERPADGEDDGQAGLAAFAADTGADEEASDTEADDSEVGASEAEDGEAVVAEPDPGAVGEGVEVVADQRELDSTIARDLSTREGVETRLETLAVGDYVLSDRVVVERKTVADFLDTLTGGDRSLFEQVGDAARHYDRPVVVIEGGGLYGERNVHPKAIHGALASLAVDFGASVMQTAGEDETADLLEVVAEREQETADREVSVHGEKQSKTLAEQQEYVVASIAEVGPVTARALLEEFGSVEAVMTADEEALQEAEGVGEVTAERVREVTGSSYQG